jgi:hypothetical protein
MNISEHLGILAQPPRDLVWLRKRLRARRFHKIQQKQNTLDWVRWAENLNKPEKG